jgi:hypothetical protein
LHCEFGDKSLAQKALTGGQFAGKNVGMPQERALIDDVERRLAAKYSALPMDQVAAVVRHAYSQFQSSRVRGFIPLLVQRRADEELEELSALRPDLAAVALDDMTTAGV